MKETKGSSDNSEKPPEQKPAEQARTSDSGQTDRSSKTLGQNETSDETSQSNAQSNEREVNRSSRTLGRSASAETEKNRTHDAAQRPASEKNASHPSRTLRRADVPAASSESAKSKETEQHSKPAKQELKKTEETKQHPEGNKDSQNEKTLPADQPKRESGGQPKRESEEQPKRESEEQPKREAAEQPKREAEEKPKPETPEKKDEHKQGETGSEQKPKAEEQPKRESEEKTKRGSEEQTKREADGQPRQATGESKDTPSDSEQPPEKLESKEKDAEGNGDAKTNGEDKAAEAQSEAEASKETTSDSDETSEESDSNKEEPAGSDGEKINGEAETSDSESREAESSDEQNDSEPEEKAREDTGRHETGESRENQGNASETSDESESSEEEDTEGEAEEHKELEERQQEREARENSRLEREQKERTVLEEVAETERKELADRQKQQAAANPEESRDDRLNRETTDRAELERDLAAYKDDELQKLNAEQQKAVALEDEAEEGSKAEADDGSGGETKNSPREGDNDNIKAAATSDGSEKKQKSSNSRAEDSGEPVMEMAGPERSKPRQEDNSALEKLTDDEPPKVGKNSDSPRPPRRPAPTETKPSTGGKGVFGEPTGGVFGKPSGGVFGHPKPGVFESTLPTYKPGFAYLSKKIRDFKAWKANRNSETTPSQEGSSGNPSSGDFPLGQTETPSRTDENIGDQPSVVQPHAQGDESGEPLQPQGDSPAVSASSEVGEPESNSPDQEPAAEFSSPPENSKEGKTGSLSPEPGQASDGGAPQDASDNTDVDANRQGEPVDVPPEALARQEPEGEVTTEDATGERVTLNQQEQPDSESMPPSSDEPGNLGGDGRTEQETAQPAGHKESSEVQTVPASEIPGEPNESKTGANPDSFPENTEGKTPATVTQEAESPKNADSPQDAAPNAVPISEGQEKQTDTQTAASAKPEPTEQGTITPASESETVVENLKLISENDHTPADGGEKTSPEEQSANTLDGQTAKAFYRPDERQWTEQERASINNAATTLDNRSSLIEAKAGLPTEYRNQIEESADYLDAKDNGEFNVRDALEKIANDPSIEPKHLSALAKTYLNRHPDKIRELSGRLELALGNRGSCDSSGKHLTLNGLQSRNELTETLLHEVNHAVTLELAEDFKKWKASGQKDKGSLTDQQIEAFQRLEKIREAAINKVGVEEAKKNNGLTYLKEFLSEGLTNKKFQRLLASIPTQDALKPDEMPRKGYLNPRNPWSEYKREVLKPENAAHSTQLTSKNLWSRFKLEFKNLFSSDAPSQEQKSMEDSSLSAFVDFSIDLIGNPHDVNLELANKDKAIEHLYAQDGAGELSEVPDGVVIEAILYDTRDKNGNLVTSDMLNKGLPDTWENDRFEGRRIKKEGSTYLWEVHKIQDKKTGDVWFLKTSDYGENDALLEQVGAAAAGEIGFGNRLSHVRVGEWINRKEKPGRWILMRDVAQMDHGYEGSGNLVFKDASTANLTPEQMKRINPCDASRMSVLDYVFQNEDRHGGNFQVAAIGDGPNEEIRLAIIDMGLLAGGRAPDYGYPGEPDKYIKDSLMKNASFDDYTVNDYRGDFNNGIKGLKELGFGHSSTANRDIFAVHAKKSIDILSAKADEWFNPQAFEQRGIKLKPIEIHHLRAIGDMVKKRIDYLLNRGGLNDLIQAFEIP